jgi:hypothetical protein
VASETKLGSIHQQQPAPPQPLLNKAAAAVMESNQQVCNDSIPSPVCESTALSDVGSKVATEMTADVAGYTEAHLQREATLGAAAMPELAGAATGAAAAAQQKGSTGSSGASHHPSPTIHMPQGSTAAATSPESVMPPSAAAAAGGARSQGIGMLMHQQLPALHSQVAASQDNTQQFGLPLARDEMVQRTAADLAMPASGSVQGAIAASVPAGSMSPACLGLPILHHHHYHHQQQPQQHMLDDSQGGFLQQQMPRSPRGSATASDQLMVAGSTPHSVQSAAFVSPMQQQRQQQPSAHPGMARFGTSSGGRAAVVHPKLPLGGSNADVSQDYLMHCGPGGLHQGSAGAFHHTAAIHSCGGVGGTSGAAGSLPANLQPCLRQQHPIYGTQTTLASRQQQQQQQANGGNRPMVMMFHHKQQQQQQQLYMDPYQQQHSGLTPADPSLQKLSAQFSILAQQQQALREQLSDLQHQERMLLMQEQTCANAALSRAAAASLPSAPAQAAGYDPQLLAAWHSFTSEGDSPRGAHLQPHQQVPGLNAAKLPVPVTIVGLGPTSTQLQQQQQQQQQQQALSDRAAGCGKLLLPEADILQQLDQHLSSSIQQQQHDDGGLVQQQKLQQQQQRADDSPIAASSSNCCDAAGAQQEVTEVVTQMVETVVAMSVRSSSVSATAAAVTETRSGSGTAATQEFRGAAEEAAAAPQQSGSQEEELTSSGDNDLAAAGVDMSLVALAQKKLLQQNDDQHAPAADGTAATAMALLDSCSPMIPQLRRISQPATSSSGGGAMTGQQRASSNSGGGQVSLIPADAHRQTQHLVHQQQQQQQQQDLLATSGPAGPGRALEGPCDVGLMGLDMFDLDDDLASHGMALDDLLDIETPKSRSAGGASDAVHFGNLHQRQQQMGMPGSHHGSYLPGHTPLHLRQQHLQIYGGSVSAGGAPHSGNHTGAALLKQHNSPLAAIQQSALMHAHGSLPSSGSSMQGWHPGGRPTVTTASLPGSQSHGHPQLVSTFQQHTGGQPGQPGHEYRQLQAGGNFSNPGSSVHPSGQGAEGSAGGSNLYQQSPNSGRLMSMSSCPPAVPAGLPDGLPRHLLQAHARQHTESGLSPQLQFRQQFVPGWPSSTPSPSAVGPHTNEVQSTRCTPGGLPATTGVVFRNAAESVGPSAAAVVRLQPMPEHRQAYGTTKDPAYAGVTPGFHQPGLSTMMRGNQGGRPDYPYHYQQHLQPGGSGSPFSNARAQQEQYSSVEFASADSQGNLSAAPSGQLPGQHQELAGVPQGRTVHMPFHPDVHRPFHPDGSSSSLQLSHHMALHRADSGPVKLLGGIRPSASMPGLHSGMQPGVAGSLHSLPHSSSTGVLGFNQHLPGSFGGQQHLLQPDQQPQSLLQGYPSLPQPGIMYGPVMGEGLLHIDPHRQCTGSVGGHSGVAPHKQQQQQQELLQPSGSAPNSLTAANQLHMGVLVSSMGNSKHSQAIAAAAAAGTLDPAMAAALPGPKPRGRPPKSLKLALNPSQSQANQQPRAAGNAPAAGTFLGGGHSSMELHGAHQQHGSGSSSGGSSAVAGPQRKRIGNSCSALEGLKPVKSLKV